MTQPDRNALRRNGARLIGSRFTMVRRLGVIFYELAQADWEMEQAEVSSVRQVLLHGRR